MVFPIKFYTLNFQTSTCIPHKFKLAQPTPSQPHRPIWELCGHIWHTANVCRFLSHNHLESKLNYDLILFLLIIDHQIIWPHTHNNLTGRKTTGTKKIIVGNGIKIPVTLTGNFQLNTTKWKNYLSNTLFSPSIKRNRKFMSIFLQENLSSMDVFQSYFLVKNWSTRAGLSRGKNRDELYEWTFGGG